jgi:hypothetical protein
MNISVKILQKKNRIVANIELGKHDDYVYRWYNSMIDLGLIYEYDNLLHPAICRSLKQKEGAIYLEPRWCHEFCMNGGLHKKKYIAAQFTTWELQEQIEAGKVIIEYWYDKKQVYQCWEKLPGRNDKTTRDLIKYTKGVNKLNRHGCLPEWNNYRAAGYSPLCCMCNENEKKILE